MASWKDILVDVLKLTDEVKRLNSSTESRADLLLSTLERYVTAMGGKLTLLAEFPNRKPTRIRTLGELKADSPELTGESGNGKSGNRAAHT